MPPGRRAPSPTAPTPSRRRGPPSPTPARPRPATSERPPTMTDTFYGSDFRALEAFDPDIAGVLVSELDRLRGGLQLIASENFSSKWFTAVHYGVDRETEDIDYDQVEKLAREHRPKIILAGGSAIPRTIDFARFRAIADEVGAIFWVDAAHFIGLVAGGAIESPVPYADVVSFTTHKVLRGPRSGAIVCTAEHATAIDKAVFPMMQGGPQMHSIAAKAVNFKECATPEYRDYARRVVANAAVLATELGARGIRPTTGGTDTHLSLHDLQGVGVTGADAESRADAAGITLNKNAIPFDPQKPNVASGIRVGTPCVTTQGMGEDEMRTVAELIHRAVTKGDADPEHPVSREVRATVSDLVARFPAYARPGANGR